MIVYCESVSKGERDNDFGLDIGEGFRCIAAGESDYILSVSLFSYSASDEMPVSNLSADY